MKITVKNKQSFTPIEVSFIIEDAKLYDDIKRSVIESDNGGDLITSTEWFNESETEKDHFIEELFRMIAKEGA